MSRQLRTIVEMEYEKCALDYGVAPCRAKLGETGEYKCFNTLGSCQDPSRFDPMTKVIRFSKPEESLPDFPVIPMVLDVSTAPTELNPGGGRRDSGPLGKRASVAITMQDAPHSDLGVDPYLAERDYDPLERGTFWAKWLARNPYYNNRKIRVYEGYADQTLEEMVRREYLIDKIDGPDSNGRVKITAKDVLKLADNDKAQAPKASTGELALDVSDEDGQTFRITGGQVTDYPAPGTVRVNDEVIRYAGVSLAGNGDFVLTGVVRASDGTQMQSHDAGDRVQYCLRYVNVRPDVMARQWLIQYGDVPASYFDVAQWNDEGQIWLSQFALTGLITEPTGVTDLLSEITEQCLFFIWWDERVQKIKMQAIKPVDDDAAVPRLNDEQNILAGSASLTVDPSARVSQVWVYWDQRDPTKRLDEEGNYRRIRVRADLAAESDIQYGEQRIKKIFSRWLTSHGQAISVSTRLLFRYRNNPRKISVEVDAKDRQYWTGAIMDVSHRNLVDSTGAPLYHRFQIISAEETVPGHKVEYELEIYEYGVGFRFGRWMQESAPDYDDASTQERRGGMWWADGEGEINGDPGYVWV